MAADEYGVASEASEWGAREQAERAAERAEEEEWLGVAGLEAYHSFFTIFKFLYFLCSQLPIRLAGQGVRKPQHDGDLRRIRSGRDKELHV